MGAPFTNSMISGARLGTNNITKLYLGHNKAWPIVSQAAFEFDTFIAAGSLDFTVVADTRWVACLINDVDMFLVEKIGNAVSSIRATSTGLDNTFNLGGGTNYKIPVKIPLYKKDIVSIRGNHSRTTRYNVDQSKGSITVSIDLNVSQTGQFRVSCTGANTITSSNSPGKALLYRFTNLNQGTKTITITNLADNTSSTTTVVINTSSKAINPKSVTLASVATFSTETSSDTLTNIKVYALTDAEAQLNLQNAYGNEASISILCDLWYVGHEREYNNAGRTDTRYSWHIAHNYFKINHGGYGYPPNATIQCRINNVYTYTPVFKSSIYQYEPFYMFNMYTNSNGTITSIGPPAAPSGVDGGYYVRSKNWVYQRWGYPAGEFGERFNILGKDNSGRQDTNNFAATEQGTTWKEFPDGSRANDLAWDWWYASCTRSEWYARQYYRNVYDYTPRGNDATTMIQEAIETNRFQLIGTGNQAIAMNYENTGTNVFNNTGQFFENLIFDSEDGIGNIKSVHLGNIDVDKIKAVRQKELIAICCKGFNSQLIDWEDHTSFIGDQYQQSAGTAVYGVVRNNSRLTLVDTPDIKYVFDPSVTFTYS